MHSHKAITLENRLVNTPFDLTSFIEQVKTSLPGLNTGDSWIHSGNRINEKYKNLISSYRLLGSYSPPAGRSRFEALLIKTQPQLPSEETDAPVFDFIIKYQTEKKIDAIFTALTYAGGNTWRFLLTAKMARTGVVLPKDLQSYIAVCALKEYLAKSCSLNEASLNGYFSKGYVLYDDTVIKQKARQIDEALSNILVCDISAETGALLTVMGNKIADVREGMNKFIGGGSGRTRERFLANFSQSSLYATDLDTGALELLKLCSLRTFGKQVPDKRVVYGSILTEDLFNGKTFDVIISNPPHIRQEEFSAVKNLLCCYKTFHKNADIYCYYIERALTMLKEGGCAGIISSNRWLRSGYGAPLRQYLSRLDVKNILDYGAIPAAKGMATPMCAITVINREAKNGEVRATVIEDKNYDDVTEVVENESSLFPAAGLGKKPWVFESGNVETMNKIAASGKPLGQYMGGAVYRGILTGLNEAFVVDSSEANDLIDRDTRSEKLLRPFAGGRNIKRYAPPAIKKCLIFIPKGFTDKMRGEAEPWSWFAENYPVIAEHLQKFKEKAAARRDKGDYWWELRSCSYCNAFGKRKIISPAIVKRISATMDSKGIFSNDKTTIVLSEDYYLLGLLNSRVMDFFARRTATVLLNGFYELKPGTLSALPIKEISKTNSYQTKLRDIIANNAKKLLSINARKETADEEENIAAERAVNRAVYKLYKLTPKEISIVENN